MASNLQSLRYSRGSLSVVDQLKLPNEFVYIDIKDSKDAWSVIKTMQVRGAPLIAITAVLGLAVEVHHAKDTFSSVEQAGKFLLDKMVYLRTSRPTAVNLFVATDEMNALVNNLLADPSISIDKLIEGYIKGAEQIYELDLQTNKSIGDFGAKRILEIVGKSKIRVLTICNTGSLATAGYGTALGVVRSLHALGKLEHVYACETRPYNQGARLTAFEIVQDKLPGTLIADSMASALMAVKGIDCVVVGADRVAANGDTANKIGTYQLAIAAKYHNVPFFAAVPTTTLDLSMASGAEIHVEERPAIELTSIFDRNIAPEGINAWNPSFDVTPCSLVRGIITELGVIEASKDAGSDGIIPIADFLRQHHTFTSKKLQERIEKAVLPIAAPSGYVKLDETKIVSYLLQHNKLVELLQLHTKYTNYTDIPVSDVKITEVGDGNLNFVYIVEGLHGSKLIVKQALPYVRCLGDSWPMTLQRAYFEYSALTEERRLAGAEYVPEVYHFDRQKALIVMRYIEPPNIILRKALIHRQYITTFAADVGQFLAKTLFGTSGLVLDGGTLRNHIAHWSENNAMCALTEKVIFTDPYGESSMNRWTKPYLDNYAYGIKQDNVLKLAANHYKTLFLSKTQALIHGDLHTGSIMASEGVTFMIDPEFAFYGPMGFDIGAVLANLFLNYFSQYARSQDDNGTYANWILQQIHIVYHTFERVFLEEWSKVANDPNHPGELYKTTVFNTQAIQSLAQTQFIQSLWLDSLGFMGMKMIRRIVGVAHVEDLESISDLQLRSTCEKKALLFAREFVVKSLSHKTIQEEYNTIDKVIQRAKYYYENEPSNEWIASNANN